MKVWSKDELLSYFAMLGFDVNPFPLFQAKLSGSFGVEFNGGLWPYRTQGRYMLVAGEHIRFLLEVAQKQRKFLANLRQF